MPSFKAVVTVRIKPSILDPQGRAVERTLERLGHRGISDLRVGKHIEFTLEGERSAVEKLLEHVAATVLSNPVMEEVGFSLSEVEKEASS